MAQAQYTTMRHAPGGVASTTTTAGIKKGVSGSAIALAVVVVAVLALAVATPALLRRRRPTEPSGGDAAHDLRQNGG